ncbi:MAG: hypothetical protein KJN89_05285 [Gammaproteobacteria bacterium]|nr:hypothetical protein [Gammaproteobacteria bacterium]NNJ49766.1 hypothetical protein [Gammaproteobacteria bacterium]
MKNHLKDNEVQPIKLLMKVLLILFSAAIAGNGYAVADSEMPSLVPPSDPKQSITYWKRYALDDSTDQVQRSQQIFSVLLRAWDQSRIEPGLYVVESNVGAWAASLADGNILLSKQAIDTCFSYGEQRGEHLLAFVLAHELAHQRADDLWHQRFFRMIGNRSQESQKKMMAGLDLDAEMLSQLQQKEAQADHDGLVLMSSVGFDAYQVINDKDFFTLWVESIWQQNCVDSQSDKSNYKACRQAQTRALRTQTQLETIAAQSMLYDLGVQQFVAGNYQQARDYFTVYGRDYPGRAIISAIGLTYFAQAQGIHKQLMELTSGAADYDDSIRAVDFYYPLILDADVRGTTSGSSLENKRADSTSLISRLQKQKSQLLDQSISQFEKAIRLAPEHRQSYLLLASAHILANNSYRVRGVLQGQYVKRFGSDPAVDMLLALTNAIEGKNEQSINDLDKLSETIENEDIASPLPGHIMRYSVTYNLAQLYHTIDRPAEAKKVWMELAKISQRKGDTLLFRLALTHIDPEKNSAQVKKLQRAPTVNGKRLGDSMSVSVKNDNSSDLWIDGERFQIVRDQNSRYVIQDDGTLISAWQSDSKIDVGNIDNSLSIGDTADRPFKTLGIPDRQLNMTSGEYLAYDDFGLAIRISNEKIKGWFLYETP